MENKIFFNSFEKYYVCLQNWLRITKAAPRLLAFPSGEGGPQALRLWWMRCGREAAFVGRDVLDAPQDIAFSAFLCSCKETLAKKARQGANRLNFA